MRRMVPQTGLALLAVLAAVGFAGSNQSTGASLGRLAAHESRVPSWFVAQYNHGAGDAGGGSPDYLSAFSTHDGRRLANLLNLDRLPGHLQLNSLDRGRRGDIWLVMASGPDIKGPGGVANPPTVPNSCRGELLRLNPATGRLTVVWNSPHDEYLLGEQLAPNNKQLAIISGHCKNNVPAEPVQILGLRTMHLRSIGANPSCGQLSFQSWSADSRQVIVYATPSSRSASVDTAARCHGISQWRALNAAGTPQDLGRPVAIPTDRGWTITDLTALRGRLLVAEADAQRGSKECRLRTVKAHADHFGAPATIPGRCRSAGFEPDASRNAALVVVDRSETTTAIGIYTRSAYRPVRGYTIPATFLASIAW